MKLTSIFYAHNFVVFAIIFRFVVSMVYFSVTFSAPTIGGDMYLNFFLSSLVELPAIPIGIWAYNRYSLGSLHCRTYIKHVAYPRNRIDSGFLS